MPPPTVLTSPRTQVATTFVIRHATPVCLQPLVDVARVDATVYAALRRPRRNQATAIAQSTLRAATHPHVSKAALSRFAAGWGGAHIAQATYWTSCQLRDACLLLPGLPGAVAVATPAAAHMSAGEQRWWQRRSKTAAAPQATPPVPVSALRRTLERADAGFFALQLLPGRALEAGVTLLLSGGGILVAVPVGALGALITLGCARLTLAQYSDQDALQWLEQLNWFFEVKRRLGSLLPAAEVEPTGAPLPRRVPFFGSST